MTPKGAVGSNPTLSVFKDKIEYCIGFEQFGEVPKWSKGLPWKGSRSLVAAQGFESLLLRSADRLSAVSTLITEQYIPNPEFLQKKNF